MSLVFCIPTKQTFDWIWIASRILIGRLKHTTNSYHNGSYFLFVCKIFYMLFANLHEIVGTLEKNKPFQAVKKLSKPLNKTFCIFLLSFIVFA